MDGNINNLSRKNTVIILMMAVFLIYLLRLFYLQVIDESYATLAERNAIRKMTVYPDRGLIYDRKGKLLVVNKQIFEIKVVPRLMNEAMDTLSFCELLKLSKLEFIDKIKKAKSYSPYLPSTFLSQVSIDEFARIQERLFEFTGFYGESRTVRDYPSPIAGHVLGYIGEVNEKHIEKSNRYYQMGDYIGMAGLEKFYEPWLRGVKGVKYQYVDVYNRVQGSFKNGEIDSSAVTGEDLHLSLDRDLQQYAEQLMINKRGSVVAIEPSTGQILTFVSSPTYNPNDMVGSKRSKTFSKLYRDPTKPLFNRPLMASYPPGSIFKLAMAIVGQKRGILNPSTTFFCGSGFNIGSLRVNCNNGENHGVPDLHHAISESCNAYFCHTFKNYMLNRQLGNNYETYRIWREDIMSFGLGKKLDIDMPNELKGLVPTNEFFDKRYGKRRWKWTNMISMAIGQGELGVTPIQMANYISVFANRGYYYTPHLIQYLGKKKEVPKRFLVKHEVADRKYFENVLNAMQAVVEHGTARSAFIPKIPILGKTGTSQNPHGKAHSIFVCFAPRENPKIALAVYVENAGYGSLYAAPIASLLVEKYMTDTIKRPWVEQRLLEANLLNN